LAARAIRAKELAKAIEQISDPAAPPEERSSAEDSSPRDHLNFRTFVSIAPGRAASNRTGHHEPLD
jgi:hypothetical protein